MSSRLARRIGLFLEGFDLRNRNRLDEAEQKFRAAWELSKRNQSINRELAKLYCRQRRYVDAELHARAAYEDAPTNPYIIDILVETLLGKWQSGQSVDQTELARLMDELKTYGDAPGSSFFLIRQAQQFLRAGNKNDALRTVSSAIDRTPNLLSAYFLRTDVYLAIPDVAGAEKDVVQINRLLASAGGFSEGEEAQLQELEARILIEKRQYEAAKEKIQNAAFLPRKMQERLLDTLARIIGFEPASASRALQEWSRHRNNARR